MDVLNVGRERPDKCDVSLGISGNQNSNLRLGEIGLGEIGLGKNCQGNQREGGKEKNKENVPGLHGTTSLNQA